MFRGLVSVNNPETDYLSRAKGYLREYETYKAEPTYLDSAYKHLHKAGWINKQKNWTAIINYFYLKEDYSSLVSFIELTGPSKMLAEILVNQGYSNSDAWAAYRIGQAYESVGKLQQSYKFFDKATTLAEYNLEFQNKLGSIQVAMQKLKNAKKTFEFILSENPLYASAHVNYGYTLLLLGDPVKAEEHYDIALSLNPDQVQALLNKAGLHLLKEEHAQALIFIERVLELDPNNDQAINVRDRLRQQY